MDTLKSYFKKDEATGIEIKNLLSKYQVLESQENIDEYLFCGKVDKIRTLIFCPSAIRCAQIYKKYRPSGIKMVKLFAKHLKIKDQIEFLKTRPKVNVGVATPARLVQIISLDRELLNQLQNVIIDMSKDKKELTILDIKETRRDLYKFLERLDIKVKIILTNSISN